MKTMKPIYPLLLGLIVTLAVAGCKHQPVQVTQIPSGQTGSPTDQQPGPTIIPQPQPGPPPGPPINPESNPQPTTIPVVADNSSFENMTMDRAALAAYTVHFAYDSAAIRKSEQSNLQAVASALASDPNTKLLIEGNCDERGSAEYNIALGEKRAEAAEKYLVTMGIPADRLAIVSYGKEKPADPGHDESAWAKNRRDEFTILSK